MPTGVAIRDVREQLFGAAERILLRDGPNALTSRAVTTEADVAKGVLHKHFADFDAFLAELIEDRIVRIEADAIELRANAGTGTVEGNVADALAGIFGPVALGIVSLVVARDELRARLRVHRPKGLPLLTEAATMLAGYLDEERRLGRIAGDADVDTLAMALIGTAHYLLAGAPAEADLSTVVSSIIGPCCRR